MDNINLIRKIAWSFHETTGIEWEDLFQEAALAYLEGLRTYDSNQGAISTYMWKTIGSRLVNFVKKESAFKKSHLPMDALPHIPCEDSDFLFSLTNDATEIANIVLMTAKRFGELPYSNVKERIYHLMRAREWQVTRITQAIHNLEFACRN